jgi:hypothetical protein
VELTVTSTSLMPVSAWIPCLTERAATGQRAQRPRPGCGEEPESAGGRRLHLGGELVLVVQQPHVGTGDRAVLARDRALDDRLPAHVDPLRAQSADG